MITALHGLLYGDDPEAARAFFRDVLQLPGADTRFDLSLMCDDLAATRAELEGRGATFEGDVVEQPWGSTIQLRVPGAGTLTLYQPKYDPPALAKEHMEPMW